MKNEENSDFQSHPEAPFATGRKVLALALAAWALPGLLLILASLDFEVTENQALLCVGLAVGAVLFGLAVFIRAAWKKRFGISLFAGGFLLLAFAAFWIGLPLWALNCHRGNHYNSAALADAKNAYTAAQVFFTDHPGETADLKALESCGLTLSRPVTLALENGTQSGLSLMARHEQGDRLYRINAAGEIKRYELVD